MGTRILNPESRIQSTVPKVFDPTTSALVLLKSADQSSLRMLEKYFHLKANQTRPAREVSAGVTTFAAMAYILVVNPAILANAGMPPEGVVVATAMAAAVGCLVMAFLTNYPIAVAPGMGTNAYFAFVICLGMEVPWQAALGMTFWNGLIFLLLSVTGFRRQLAESLPEGVKIGIQVGIGFFIAFIGLKNVGIIIQDEATFVSIGEVASPGPVLVLLGVVLMVFLTMKRIPGAILGSIFLIALIGLFIPQGGEPITALPEAVISWPDGWAGVLGQLDVFYLFQNWQTALPVVLTLLILDLFDSIGTLVGLSHRAGLVNEEGKMPKMGRALSADSVATMVGAVFGTSTTTSYIESAAGVESGGRTGLTSIVTAVCFLLAIFFTPVFIAIPAIATAPALIMVGILMAQGIERLDFQDYTQLAPAVLTMLTIPLTFSITEGIGIGLFVFVLLQVFRLRFREVPLLTWVIAVLFVLHYLY